MLGAADRSKDCVGQGFKETRWGVGWGSWVLHVFVCADDCMITRSMSTEEGRVELAPTSMRL